MIFSSQGAGTEMANWLGFVEQNFFQNLESEGDNLLLKVILLRLKEVKVVGLQSVTYDVSSWAGQNCRSQCPRAV